MSSFLIIIICLYFVPSIVAWVRGHHNKIAITALNILLGWSVIGWVGAMVWSLMAAQPRGVVVQAPNQG
ncbi:MAG: superinfection immunity protein [Lysobacteraceae bacterium]|jgi:hypothetical protein|nr:MAG: superinfection immunity protein [Xanthomonadaceae bacterium]